MTGSNVPLVVSVQAHGFEEKPWEGHLATGVLVAPDEVLVPSAPAELAEATGGLDLLLLPLPLDEGRRIERLPVEGVLLSATREGGDERLAVLRVGNPSRHAPQVRPFRGTDLDEAVRAHDGDLWAALEAVDAVSPGVRDAITPDLLRQAAAVEEAQRAPRRDEHSLAPGPASLCPVIKACILPTS
ncbi:hypothetical protein ACFXGA_06715 [Actinosynnema sp. NPDC059335]|uniref:hypothetical protein n=1 Tax=Actinosynnema sp. NPDC059335 TaxID=3346804 RepID=UPI00366EC5EA